MKLLCSVLLLLLLLLQAVLVICHSTDNTKAAITKRNAPSSNETKGLYEGGCLCKNGRDGRDGLPGRDGRDGRDGQPGRGEKGDTGSKSEGGVVYIRWGRTSCPNDTGAQLVYDGMAGGTKPHQYGGGANYICLPKIPQYMSTLPKGYSYVYGADYDLVNNIFPGKHNHNVPCAVCHSSTKEVKLMIPARTSCPSSWTVEYKGYLMADHYLHKRNVVYECVDENAESIPGTGAYTAGSSFFTVSSTCTGLPCPPYVDGQPITCVVCTK